MSPTDFPCAHPWLFCMLILSVHGAASWLASRSIDPTHMVIARVKSENSRPSAASSSSSSRANTSRVLSTNCCESWSMSCERRGWRFLSITHCLLTKSPWDRIAFIKISKWESFSLQSTTREEKMQHYFLKENHKKDIYI